MSADGSQHERVTEMFFRAIPAELKKAWKAICASNGETMQERFIKLMQKDVKHAGRKRVVRRSA